MDPSTDDTYAYIAKSEFLDRFVFAFWFLSSLSL
jgi:hypothetical protein